MDLKGLSDDALLELLQNGLNVLRERKRVRPEEPQCFCYLQPNPIDIPETEFKSMIAATYRMLGGHAQALVEKPSFNMSTSRIEMCFKNRAALDSARAHLRLRGHPYELLLIE